MDNRFIPFDPRVSYQVNRRKLPHWTQAECTYFVTFHTADSIPEENLRILLEERDHLLKLDPRRKGGQTARRLLYRYQKLLERFLDLGHGACPFQYPAVARLLESHLRQGDGKQYFLDHFVIMPNHCHTLVKPLEPFSLREIVHGWKSVSAIEVNRLIDSSGQMWTHESFDHIVRSWNDLERFRRYLEENPQKAHSQKGKYILGKGSGLTA